MVIYCFFLQKDHGGFVQPGPGETKPRRPGGSVADELPPPAAHCDERQPLTEAAGSNEGTHHASSNDRKHI